MFTAKPRQMTGFFYAVDFGKLNQRFLGHIELVEGTSSLSRAHRACRGHIELVGGTSSLSRAHRACRGHIELVEMGTSTSLSVHLLSVHLLSVHLDKENARLKNYHIFK
jgi:hypothetical protein